MAPRHINIPVFLVVSFTFLCRITQTTGDDETGSELTSPTEKDYTYDCTKQGDMKFDFDRLPKDYHLYKNFTVQHCNEADFFSLKSLDNNEPLQWTAIHFKNIDVLKLRFTQLPSSIQSIEIDSVTLDEMSIKTTHFRSTFEINTLTIKNSILKSISTDTYRNPEFQNVVFHNVTFQTIATNSLMFKFGENSIMKIEKSVFQNDVPTGAIATQNANFIYIEDVIFASKLTTNSINFNASEKITITKVTFTDLDQDSLVLSAPSIELTENIFEKTTIHSINLNDSNNLVISNNTFQVKVKNPINWEQSNHHSSPEFSGNSFPCDASYSSNATQWMVNTIEQFSSEKQTFCYLLELNMCKVCKCDINTLFDEILQNKNCSVTIAAHQKNNTSNNGKFSHVSILTLAVNVAILKLFHM